MSGGPTGPALIVWQGSGFVWATIKDGEIIPNKSRPVEFELARAGPRKLISAEALYKSLREAGGPSEECLSRLLDATDPDPVTKQVQAPFFTLEFKLKIDAGKNAIVGTGYVQPYVPADRLDKGA